MLDRMLELRYIFLIDVASIVWSTTDSISLQVAEQNKITHEKITKLFIQTSLSDVDFVVLANYPNSLDLKNERAVSSETLFSQAWK